MAISCQVLLPLVAVAALLIASPIQARIVDASNSSFINKLIPGFGSDSLLDLGKWLDGIPSFFPGSQMSSYPKIETINGNKIWSFTIDVEGYNVNNLNVTHQGFNLRVIGKVLNDRNHPRQMMYQQTLPVTSVLGKLIAVMKGHKLTITVPMEEGKVVKIPIKVDTDLKFKQTKRFKVRPN